VLSSTVILEEYVFAKPYFDPAGLVIALDNGQIVGFAHAGFGPAPSQKQLSTTTGVLCLVGVRPSHRRRGIASELLRRSEAYLRERGAQTLLAGPMPPFNPFYFGLYGGSNSAGFLASDAPTGPFLARHGYVSTTASLVFQRALQEPIAVVDTRSQSIRRRFELVAGPRNGVGTWWEECTLGSTEFLDITLVEKGSERTAGRVAVWEMAGFSQRWQAGAVGIIDLEVRPDLRRQGLARFLMTALLRHLQDQFFSLVEVHTLENKQAAIALYDSLFFQKVDVGRLYRKQ
jgi:ribosomal protein S18 acetylase RimI-like enzyme